MIKFIGGIQKLFLAGLLMLGQRGIGQSYYFTGKVYDEFNHPIENASVRLKSSGAVAFTGNLGEFGMAAFVSEDSALVYARGFDTLRIYLKQGKMFQYVLKMGADLRKRSLRAASFNHKTWKLQNEITNNNSLYVDVNETYLEMVPNTWVSTSNYPSISIVPNSNTASLPNLRRFLKQAQKVPPNALRVEEFWNSYNLQLTGNYHDGKTIGINIELTRCPWNERNWLLAANTTAPLMPPDSVKPVNMVWLIDNSGSMAATNRMDALQSGFKKMATHLQPHDQVAIVTYGGRPGIHLPPTPGFETTKIIAALDSLVAEGDTQGGNGILLAYQLILGNFVKGGTNSIILASDGDFNVGAVGESELEQLVLGFSDQDVVLNCLGVGMGNYKDSKIELLAKVGKGRMSYAESEEEAQNILLQWLRSGMAKTVSDAVVSFSFSPNLVKKYQLFGYNNKQRSLQNQRATLIGADMYSGQSNFWMFELEPVDTGSLGYQSLGEINMEYFDEQIKKNQRQSFSFNAIPNLWQQTQPATQSAAALYKLVDYLKLGYQSPTFKNWGEVSNLLQYPHDAIQISIRNLIAQVEAVYHPAPVIAPKKVRKKNKLKS